MNDINTVTKKLSEKEQLAAIVWLIIGIIQCLSFVLIISGVWNIYCAVTRFKQAKAVLNPWPGLVDQYDKSINNIIIAVIINVIFGGVIGVAGCIFDYMTRSYVLENREVFENAVGQRRTNTQYRTNPQYNPNVQRNPNPQYNPNVQRNPNPQYNPNVQRNPNAQYNPNAQRNPNPQNTPNAQANPYIQQK